MEVKNSWKGGVWLLWFLWPIAFWLLIDINYENIVSKYLAYSLIIIGSVIWVLLLIRLIKKFKNF